MIPAWDQALQSMSVGERSLVRVHNADLAYGAQGVPPLIPPNAVLEFDVQLLQAEEAMTNINFDSIASADTTPVRCVMMMMCILLDDD